MVGKDVVARIEEAVRVVIEPLGYELVELKCMHINQGIVVQLLVDRMEGGITLGECAELNSRIGKEFEEKNIISQSWTLEVSSPGIDRFLVKPKDFKRALNRPLLVFFKPGNEGQTQTEGIVTKVGEEGIYCIDKAGKEVYITFTKIHKAKQVIR